MEIIIHNPSANGSGSNAALRVAAKNNQLATDAFLLGNTLPIDWQDLKQHQALAGEQYSSAVLPYELVRITRESLHHIFSHEKIAAPLIRVAYASTDTGTGETAANDGNRLEKMVFTIELPSVSDTVGGEPLCMTVGGSLLIREEKAGGSCISLFAGFTLKRTGSICVFREGLLSNLHVQGTQELKETLYGLLCEYDSIDQLEQLERLTQHTLSAGQVACLLGKATLYQQLPTHLRGLYPELLFTEPQLSGVAKDYTQRFLCEGDNGGDITLWQLYQLLLQANKTSFIDFFLARSANAASFVGGLARSLTYRRSHWFLS